jgi:hypothetical protein
MNLQTLNSTERIDPRGSVADILDSKENETTSNSSG